MDSSSTSLSSSIVPVSRPELHRDTTYQYGTRQGMDKVLREIEQSGRNASSLLVTRGHLELEVFTEPQNPSLSSSPHSLSSSSWLHGSPVGTYTTPAYTRPIKDNGNSKSNTTIDDSMHSDK